MCLSFLPSRSSVGLREKYGVAPAAATAMR
jgi:hypothetical protein